MSQLLAGLFEMHNRDKFEIIGFSLIQNKSDEFKERITKSLIHLLMFLQNLKKRLLKYQEI